MRVLAVEPRAIAEHRDHYAAEDLVGIDRGHPAEWRRRATAQRYLKRLRYGNTRPLALDESVLDGMLPSDLDWHFHVVLDYGDHADLRPGAEPDRPWPDRPDPTSNGRPGFDLRTYRLCRRILMFHEFPELGPGPTLVTQLALDHRLDPAGSTLETIRQIGHRREPGADRALPPLRLTYAPSATATAFTPAPAETQANVPAGLSSPRHRLVDLFGEGLPGILADEGGAWYWKPNRGDGRFGEQAVLLEQPAARPGAFALGDRDRDGDTDLSRVAGRLAGSYALERESGRWHGFRPLTAVPHVEAFGGRAQWIDLNGDGLADVVIGHGDHLVWYPSDGDGFGPAVHVPLPAGMPSLAQDAQLDLFFADMNGDGLVDLVRVENGRVQYWPNLGNGQFGDAVLVDGAPQFAAAHRFDSSRVRFVDLDGSGTADVLYLGEGEVQIWINASGNTLVPGPHLRGLPVFDNLSSIQIADLLGDGRPCLVWSSPLPGSAAPLQYLPLTPPERPRLLLSVADSLGHEIRLTYSSSARHYLRDQANGRAWTTKLPSHVMVVDRREALDLIGGTRSVTRYEYHDGCYDGAVRELRGFGCVDVYDADSEASTGADGAAFTAPALTRTWYHLGTATRPHARPYDRYAADPELPELPSHVLEGSFGPGEADDAERALAGTIVRREVFAVDAAGCRAEHPFEVSQTTSRARKVQDARGGARAAFVVVPEETLVATYEQEASDPRVRARVSVAIDAYDQVIREADVAYGRRPGRPHEVNAQAETSVTFHEIVVLHIDTADRFELGIPVEDRDLELPDVAQPGGARIAPAQLRAAALGDGRLLGWERSIYWDDAQAAPLPLGQVGAVVLVHHEETAVVSLDELPAIYDGRVDSARLAAAGYVLRDAFAWRKSETHHFAGPFLLRVALERADGARTHFTHDTHALHVVAIEDALGNVIRCELDYHQVAAWRITDPNGAIAEVRYDPLGVVVASSRYGQVAGRPWGMAPLAEHVPTTEPDLDAVVADPGVYLQLADRVVHYDLEAWTREGAPIAAVTLTRETLVADGAGGGTPQGRIHVVAAHLDGAGRVLQEKLLVDPGLAIQRDGAGHVVVDESGHPVLGEAAERWRASGYVQYDAKQRPARKFEPFFATTWRFEGDDELARLGVATLTLYDAIGRVSRREHPNGTFELTRYAPWAIEHADPNDTVEDSTYRLLREGRPVDDPERQAYEHARGHAGTPTTIFLDARGLEVATLARGGTTHDRRTETRYDAAGHVREIIDARGLTAFTYRRDLEGRVLASRSVDAGDTWFLYDDAGRVVESWDGRGFDVTRAYDLLDRPTTVQVRGGGLDHRVEERTYGESISDAATRNQRGRLVAVRDQAGESILDQYDPDGAILRSTRRLRADVAGEPDWRSPVPLGDTFAASVQYDALGRAVHETLADGATLTRSLRRDGGLARVALTTPDGALVDVPILDDADHDAHGRRTRTVLGNGVEVVRAYDRDTFRLASQRAARGPRRYQDLRYTYDPVGNLVRLHDHAHDPGPAAVIRGTAMPARRDHVYDAHYRLVRATGRVHQALLARDHIPGTSGTIKGTRHIGLDNGAALEAFTRTYDYDAAGNLHAIRHAGASRSWTTSLWVSPTRNRALPEVDPNGAPVIDPEARFDAAGHMLRLDHVRTVEWSWRGTLARAAVIERADGVDDAEAYAYDADGRRIRKVWRRVVHGGQLEEIEKVYLGPLERKRILRDGEVLLERWTVHVSDGDARVALVHRWTVDALAREVDAPTARIHYQLTTHQGSSAFELDHDGEIISYEEYFPYGGTAFVAGDRARDVALKDYRYSGKERDDATGLYDYGYRYYAPWIGRWLSPDPVGPADDLNLYQFVLGDPVGNVDPDGLQTSAKTTRFHRRRVEWEGGDIPDIPADHLVGKNPESGEIEHHSLRVWRAIFERLGITDVLIRDYRYDLLVKEMGADAADVVYGVTEALDTTDELFADLERRLDTLTTGASTGEATDVDPRSDHGEPGLAAGLGTRGSGPGESGTFGDFAATGDLDVDGRDASAGGSGTAARVGLPKPSKGSGSSRMSSAPSGTAAGLVDRGSQSGSGVLPGLPGGQPGGLLGATRTGAAGDHFGPAGNLDSPARDPGVDAHGPQTSVLDGLSSVEEGAPAPADLVLNGEDPRGTLDPNRFTARKDGHVNGVGSAPSPPLAVPGGSKDGRPLGQLPGTETGTSARVRDLLDDLTTLAGILNLEDQASEPGPTSDGRGVPGGQSDEEASAADQLAYLGASLLQAFAFQISHGILRLAHRALQGLTNLVGRGLHAAARKLWRLRLRLRDPNAGFSEAERRIADYMRALGREVISNPRQGMPNAGRQGDAFVDFELTEFKTLTTGANNNTIKNSVDKSIEKAAQARSIVIDARGTGLSEQEARRGIFRALGAARDKLDYIAVIGDGYFIGYGPRRVP